MLRDAGPIHPTCYSRRSETVVTTGERKPWHAIFRLLERDERVFAVLLAVAMVGGLATLGLVPLRPRQQIDLYSARLLVHRLQGRRLRAGHRPSHAPRARSSWARWPSTCSWSSSLLFLTGGRDSALLPAVLSPAWRSTPTTSGPGWALAAALVAGGLYAAASALAPPWAGWTAVSILAALFGIPAVTLGIVAERERRARGEVERLNDELTGTLNRLQTTQQELLVAERMATVGPPVAPGRARGAQPDQRHRAERRDAAGHRQGARRAPRWRRPEALVTAIRDQVNTLDALTEEYLAFARFPKPHFEEESINHLLEELADFVRPVATRQGLTVRVANDPAAPMMEIDRGLLRQAVHEPREERHGGALARRRDHASGAAADGDARGDLRVRHRRRASPEVVGRGCSSRSSPPSRREPVSASPSPGRSPRSTAASSAWAQRPRAAARPSRSGCP